ncbi:MAG: hypothetical protein LBF40_05330, partial [Deltaproteobacteria bacterium]|nr:hypothetical protein [Deltaproteobacteria bacterium]
MTPYKTLTSILAALMLPAIFACLWASPVFAQLTVTVRKTTDTPLPERVDYESSPFMAVGSIVPHVMIVMAKNLKMFQHGYPGLTDLDGDGRADTGFNPSVEYVGYFDSRSCYKYMGKDFVSLSRTYYATGDTTGYFVRVGPTKEDESESTINASRPSGLKSYVVSPRSKTGICNDPNQSAATRTFSGNWLNYITTSRMDAIRRILYGGTREEDTATRTMLVGSFVPPDSTTWGSEVRSDDTWQEITPLNAYFDVRKYTIYDKPKSKTAHFFARGSDLGTYNKHFPAIRVLLNANAASFNEGGYDSVSVKVTITKPYPRYWDWVLVNRPLPDDMVLKSEAIRKSIKIYNIRVLACEPGNMGEGEGCRRYPGTTESEADDVWKPSGLLQKYGEGSSPMYFGLITGTYGNNLRKQGGMLRAQMGPVQGLPPANSNVFVPSVDLRTGQFIEKGLIRNIDYLRISGKPLNLEPTTFATNGSAGYKNTYSWYNPLGEMTYEAARYLAGSQSPTTLFSNDSDKDDGETNSSIYKLTQFRSTDGGGKAWTLRRPELPTALCFKPVILLISDITTDYDGDNLGTDLKR